MKHLYFVLTCFIISSVSYGQGNPFDKISFIIGDWTGSGSGFGNETSNIESSFQFTMDGKYIEVKNESKFAPTDKNPKGEHHIDKGFISFDKSRNAIVFRQFNNEGYFNRYVLNDSISDENILVFETEYIENFVPNGKAKWTIKKLNENEIETVFDVSLGKEYSCFGTNKLIRKQNTSTMINNLDGTWIPIKQEINGAPLPESVFQNQKLILNGNTYIVHAESIDKGTLEYQDGQMDIFGKEGPNKDKHITAIYKLEKDTLTICYNLRGDGYPTEFESTSKPNLFLSTFKKHD